MHATGTITLDIADAVERNAHKLNNGEIVDIFGNTWGGPET
eukprot:IDg20041t1